MQQLLWLETLLKLTGGALLLLAPLATIKILGLHPSPRGFWPRMLGVSLIGIAAATFIEGAWEGSKGLGIVGIIVINILSAAVLALMALFGNGAPTRRGRLTLWGLVVSLFVLVLFEIAHI